ncbi:MAG: glucosyltransferase domain-containing protein [Actinomycetota bacterium]
MLAVSAPPEDSPAARTLRAAGREMAREATGLAYRRAAAGAAILGLMAYGFAMANFTLAGDEWFSLYPEFTLDTDYTLWAGRWLMPVIWSITGNGAFVPYVTLAVALALLTLAGLLAASAWRFTGGWPVFAVTALFVTCPLLTDSLSFEQGHISSPLAMVVAATAGWLVLRHGGKRLLRIVTVAGLVAWTLASYQPTALVFAVVVMGGEVRRAAVEGPGYWRAAFPRWLDGAAAVLAGVAVYAVSVPVAWWVTGTDPGAGRGAYSLVGGYPALGDLAGLVRSGGRAVGRFWFGDTALYPFALKAFGIALIVGGAAAAATRAAGRREVGCTRWGRAGTAAWVALLAAASLVVPFSVLFLRSDPPADGSNFTTVGLVVGFWAGLALEEARRRKPARGSRGAGVAVGVVVLVLALGGAFQVNRGFVGLYLGNQRDLFNANRMLAVMEQMPEFSSGEEVRMELVGRVGFHLTGPPLANPVPGTPGTTIVNCSGLACQNRLVHMLNLIGGGERGFVVKSVSRRPAVREEVAGMPSWPEPGSIRYLEGTFVIKGG